MISIANTTDIFFAPETTWGEASSGTYIALPVLTETLVPEKRLFQPTHLGSQTMRADPVTTETLVAGEIEAMATAPLLRSLLPLSLRGTVTKAIATVPATEIDSEGSIAMPDLLKGRLQSGDVIWLESNKGEIAGFHDVITPKTGTTLRISGLPLTLPDKESISIGHASLRPGEDHPSVTLARRYGDSSDWMFFDGMMIRRLVLDFAETDLPAVTASFIGRAMKLQKMAPETASGASGISTAGPLGLGADLRHLELKSLEDKAGFTLDAVVATRLRLIIDHAGMSPQFALGDLAPVALLPGQLNVHGMIEVMITDTTLFTALNEGRRYQLSFSVQDAAEGGCAVIMPSVLIDAVEGAISSGDGPVRTRFHFRAVPDRALSSLIRIFFDER